MNIRIIKILLSLSIALLALFYAGQNLANLDSGVGAVGYVMSLDEHEAYPRSFGPSVESKTLHWIAFALIIFGELVAGLLALKGSWDMWLARHAVAAEFHAAKRLTVMGAGVAMLVWFGLFHAIGGALFQQWQTPAGDQSLHGAFWFVAGIGIVTLYITLVEDDF